MSAPTLPLYINAKQIPELYGIPWGTVRSWIYRKRDGRSVSPIPFSRVGRGAVLFHRLKLEAYIERQAVGGGAAFPRRAIR